MSTYNFSSVDPEHYNRIRATIPNHLAIRTVNICVSTLTTNCNIEVMNEQDYIEFEITEDNKTTKHKVFMKPQSNISAVSISDILNDIFAKQKLKITVSLTDINTIKFTSAKEFSIRDMSYNMKLICGFYCLEESKWPIKSTKTKVPEEYEVPDELALEWIKFDDVKVRTGEWQPIKQTLTPNNAYGFTCVYTTPDESIARVDQYGYIYGVSAGTIDMKYEVRNTGVSEYVKPDYTGTFKVEVRDPENALINKFSIPKEITMKVNEEMIIEPTIGPYYADYFDVKWLNYDTDIVVMSHDRHVRAIKTGTAKIAFSMRNWYKWKTEEGEQITEQDFGEWITITVIPDEVDRYIIQSDTVGYYLSTPILYLLTNVGNHVFFNEMHNSKRLQCGTVCMCLNNSYSASFPIIACQGEIITRCSIGHASDIWFILVDANMKEVKLLNPMYITVSVRPDESDPATTPGLL